MKLDFFDCNVFMGCSSKGTYKPAVSDKELIGYMDNVGIGKALVWHIAQKEYSVVDGNTLLSNLIREEERLFGCWTVIPPQTGEIKLDESFFRKMREEKIFALRVFPDEHRFLLNRVVFGDFLDELTRRKIPLMITAEERRWKCIYDLLAQFPELTLIICETGVWGTDRYFRPLLESYRNVYIDSSLLSIGDGVMEDVVGKYGSERIVFGSSFPTRYPESAMLQLIHADIADDAKNDIACGNLERLMREAIR